MTAQHFSCNGLHDDNGDGNQISETLKIMKFLRNNGQTWDQRQDLEQHLEVMATLNDDDKGKK